jgi:uncharacterized protein (DUF983 family)
VGAKSLAGRAESADLIFPDCRKRAQMWHPDARRLVRFIFTANNRNLSPMTYEIGHQSGTDLSSAGIAPSKRSVWRAMWNGIKCRCPRCGTGKLFSSYLKVADECLSCNQALHHHRADDAPPYFTMFIVGHLLVPLVFFVERKWEPSLALHAAMWLPLCILLTLWLLPLVKGAVVGLQWAIGMHGFGLSDEESSNTDANTLEPDNSLL